MGRDSYNDSSYQSGGQQDTSSWRAHYGVDPRIGRDLDNRNQQLQQEVQNYQPPRKWAPDPGKLRDWKAPMDDPNLNKVMQDLRTQGLPNVFGRPQPGYQQQYGQPGYTGLDQQGYGPSQNYQNVPMYNPNPQRYAPALPQNYPPAQNFGPSRNYASPQDLGPPQNYTPAQNFGSPQSYSAQSFRPPQTYVPAQNYGPQNYGYPPNDQGSSNYNFNPQQGIWLGPVGDNSQLSNNNPPANFDPQQRLWLGPVGDNSHLTNNPPATYNFNPQQGIWLGPVGDNSQLPNNNPPANFNPQQGIWLGPVGDNSHLTNNPPANYNFNPQQGIWLGPVSDDVQPPYTVPHNQYATPQVFYRSAPPYVAPRSNQLPLISAAPNLQRPLFTSGGDNKPWLPPSGS